MHSLEISKRNNEQAEQARTEAVERCAAALYEHEKWDGEPAWKDVDSFLIRTAYRDTARVIIKAYEGES